MIQEHKKLLFKDLCTRLPYGVKAYVKNWSKLDRKYYEGVYTVESIHPSLSSILVYSERFSVEVFIGNDDYEIKPYLIPLSSITEEQIKEYYSLADDVTIKPGQNSYFGIKIHCIKLGISDNPHEGVWDWIDLDAIDWLNSHHFDYRGLIEKGLAIVAPEGMYN